MKKNISQSRLIASIQVYGIVIHLWFEAPTIIQFSKGNERNRDVYILKHQHAGTLLLLFVHDLCEIWIDNKF